MTINQLDDGLKTLIKQHKNYQKRPLIIYSAVWPFLKIMKGKKNKIILDIFNVLTNLRSKNQDLLMPSFGNGYKDGIFNSDNEKSKNGILSEMFRMHPKSERTLSAFFSYNILGPEQKLVSNLKPKNCFGKNSIYEWMEKKNGIFLMFGTHLTHCSYLHRFEWLIKEKINYRFEKIFKGYIVKNNEKKFIKENLFARLLKPEAVNDFTILKKAFIDDSKIYFYKKIGIYTIGAKKIKKKFYPLIKKDPFLVLKNKSDFS